MMRLSRIFGRGVTQRLILALIFVLSVSWSFNLCEHPASWNFNFYEQLESITERKTELKDGYIMVKKPVLQMHVTGRMGNCILQWGTAMEIAKQNDMDLCCLVEIRSQQLETWFDSSFPFCGEDATHGYIWDARLGLGPETIPISGLIRDPKDYRNVKINGSFNNVTEWDSVKDEILDQFTIRKEHVKQATEFIQNQVGDDYITVGIHARYGDKGRNRGWLTADRDYYVAAMEAAQKTIRENGNWKDIRFLVATEPEDVAWWDSLNLPLASKVIHINMADYIDFTVLTLCDHLIISEGTYSYFASWYAENGLTRKKENDGKRYIFYDPKYWAPNVRGTPFPAPSWTQVSDALAESRK